MTPRPTLPPARSTALWRSPSRIAADVHVEQPAVDPATAALPDRYGPSPSFVLPSQLLQIELLRRPLEFAQYLSIRYTDRLAEAGAVRSVGSKGDSFDNAVAETVHGLYKAELINRRGPWRGAEQVELATGEWVDWWNRMRLHAAAANLPPAEYEELYYQSLGEAPDAA